jgi:hydroxypyruvate isomerase
MGWTVKFAPHLSFSSLKEPYFGALTGGFSPLDQIRLAAEHGFPAMFDLQILQRPADEQAAVTEALGRHGLALSSILPHPDFRAAPWTSSAPEDQARLAEGFEATLDAAVRVGAGQVLLVAARGRLMPIGQQVYAFGETLRRLARIAEARGVTVCVEHVSPARAPDAMLHRLVDAYTVVRLAESPAVKLTLDTYHLALTEGDVTSNLRWAADRTACIQLADTPGRVEPGSGEHDFAQIIGAALDVGFQGVFELEHFFSRAGPAGVEQALANLRAIDEAVRTRRSPREP